MQQGYQVIDVCLRVQAAGGSMKQDDDCQGAAADQQDALKALRCDDAHRLLFIATATVLLRWAGCNQAIPVQFLLKWNDHG